jgi:dTDP-4-amino-4,6-dideoxygalactose transaminase
MPISRGSIQHSLQEDFLAACAALSRPGALARRATPDQRKELESFIREMFEVPSATLFSYARTAFHAILKALDLPPGSEILMTPITIGPMLEIVLHLGYRPLFVDLELDTFCVDLEDLKSKLQRAPSCFLLTYLFGYVPDVPAIRDLCRASGTLLIEDFSHDIGARFDGRLLGTFGDAGIFSASLLKYVDGYNGAFVVCSNRDLAGKIREGISRLHDPDPARIRKIVLRTLIWNLALNRYVFQGITYPALALLKFFNPKLFEKILGPSIKLEMKENLPNYYFEDITGFQCRTIRTHLKSLAALIAQRVRTAMTAIGAYRESLLEEDPRQPRFLSLPGNRLHTFWQFVVPVRNLPSARNALFRDGVETGSTNLMNLAEQCGQHLPNAAALKDDHLFIPLHVHLTHASYRRIFGIIRSSEESVTHPIPTNPAP